MKRLFCTLIVIICFACSAASAGGHIGIEGTVSGQNNGEIITADLYQQNGDTILVSSLFPDLAVILNHGCCTDEMLYELFLFKPGRFASVMDMTDRILAEWLQRLNMKTHSGSYSGEVFEYASSVSTTSFQLSDFARFLDDVFSKEYHPDTETDTTESVLYYGFLSDVAKKLQSIPENDKILVSVRCYDENRYFTFAIQKQNETICTISVDNTADHARRVISGHKENGKYYYHDITYSAGLESFTVENRFYGGTQSSFLNLSDRNPLIRASLYAVENSDHTCRYEYKAESAALGDPFIVSGIQQENSLSLEIHAGESGREIAHISTYYDNMKNPVSFSDKKTLDSELKEDYDTINMNFIAAGLTLADKVFPNLPLSYQKIIFSLMPGL